MIALSISSGYLLDSNYSEYSYYILDEDENFLVFVICDEPNELRYGFKISEIFSRTFCTEVYNNRYITNLKNLIEVGFYEGFKRIDKFLKQKEIDYDNLNISIAWGIYRNGKLMLFSLGNSPVFVIDKDYCLYCPFDLDDNYNLRYWEKFIKFSKLIENPKSVIACSNKLNGKVFKFKNENNKLIAEPFKYRILDLINSIVSNRENIDKIRERLRNNLNLDNNTPLFIVSFDEKPIDDKLVKVGKPKLKIEKHEHILEDKKEISQNIELKIIKNVALVSILILIVILGLFVVLHSKNSNNYYSGNIINNISDNLLYQPNISKISTINVDNKKVNKKLINISNNSSPIIKTTSSLNTSAVSNDKDSLKILVKFQVDKISKGTDYIPISIIFPEQGYYYISIKSKNNNIELVDVKNGNVLYKNATSIELFEEIKEKEKTYNLIVRYNNLKISPEEGIDISISKIKIIK
ncbi:hypothetical protein JH146_1018 [Methanocaldococcus bathoardescens]|uniref:Uncharacterized protein n=1 Tax=Methanocaldococcus bathoardescens TaxID=1301915 RepID=A0A076LCE8_9EURY|nr:hypothetical protein [Methanocaldococcus bathoardescens]AIJ05861.1 hypothetical protein JH146_1018 [Methanocaldococcus bathoardescens]